MRVLVIAAFAVLVAQQIVAQNELSGVVYSSDSTTTLQGCYVRIIETGKGTVTNGSGTFSLSDVPANSFTLEIGLLGFETQQISCTSTKGKEVEVYLEESIQMGNEVLIVAKGNKGLRDVPGSIQYISPLQLQKFSYTDIQRTLRSVPGVNIQEEDGFGLRPNIGLRGTGVERSSKITLMEDGILAAPAPYADPAAYYFPTTGRMNGVEIAKGSSQIKYGPFTTGGSLHLLSTPIPNEFTARIHLLGGQFGNRQLHAFAGDQKGHFGYLVETFQYGSDGFKTLPGGQATGFDKEDYVLKFRYQTIKAKVFQSFAFKWAHTRETSHETYLGITEDDFNNKPFERYAASQNDVMSNEHNQWVFTHVIKPAAQLSITTNAYYQVFDRNWYRIARVQDSSGTKYTIADILDRPTVLQHAYQILKGESSGLAHAVLMQNNNRSYFSRGAQTHVDWQFNTGAFTHKVEAGGRWHQDQVDRFQWVDEYAMDNGQLELINKGTPGTESNRIIDANAISAYLQFKTTWKNWSIQPGIRLESISFQQTDYGTNDTQRTGANQVITKNEAQALIPGVGIDYRFSKFLSVFGGVHKGFAPPGVRDETKPEQSINYESGVRFAKSSKSLTCVVFLNDYSNLLGSDLSAAGAGGTGDQFNAGQVRTQGVEFQAGIDLMEFQATSEWSIPVQVSYTYTDASFTNSFTSTFADFATVKEGDKFPYMSMHQLYGSIGVEWRKWSIQTSGRYVSEMRTKAGSGDIPTNQLIPSSFVMDASASFRLNQKVQFFASATNITNETYIVARRPAGLRPGMPFAAMAGFKLNF